jgi:hypothetical protein
VTQSTLRRRAVRTLLAAGITAAAGAAAFQTLGRADSRSQPVVPPTLRASAVAYLPSHASRLTAQGLAKDADLSSTEATLSRLGFVTGGQRLYQGPSKHRLQVVVSRTLRFRTQTGARGFVAFMHDHAGAFVGEVPTLQPLESNGRRGWLIVAPLCACHMAQPNLLAVVSAGRDVTWLMVNGPGAKPAVLRDLLARAP